GCVGRRRDGWLESLAQPGRLYWRCYGRAIRKRVCARPTNWSPTVVRFGDHEPLLARGSHSLSPSTRRPASVILTRVTPIARLPITTRRVCAVASPARTRSAICLVVKPYARMTASVQPSRLDASSSSARWRDGGDGRRFG